MYQKNAIHVPAKNPYKKTRKKPIYRKMRYMCPQNLVTRKNTKLRFENSTNREIPLSAKFESFRKKNPVYVITIDLNTYTNYKRLVNHLWYTNKKVTPIIYDWSTPIIKVMQKIFMNTNFSEFMKRNNRQHLANIKSDILAMQFTPMV